VPSLQRSLLTFYSPAQMYALVADVERYPEFLPGCTGARVVSREDDVVVGTVDLALKGLRQSFTTRNRLVPERRIDMELVEGPFKRLSGGWRFEPLGSGCKVSLALDFELASRALALALGPAFNHFAGQLAEAFLKRAEAVYGKP
jgi:ribosome-associated toxin RatA of RatAB toxin-antitoxin module